MGIPSIDIDGLPVAFPYDHVYPEQVRYMIGLKRCIDAKGHGLLEMPTGTGKTVSVFALALAYLDAYPATGKLVFCTRTVPEMSKALGELRKIWQYRKDVVPGYAQKGFFAVGASSRKNLCINDDVRRMTPDLLNAKCRELTAVRDIEDSSSSSVHSGCKYHESYVKTMKSNLPLKIPSGVYSVDELKALGLDGGWCPYFSARKFVAVANVVVFSYQYLLDPGVSASAPLFPYNSQGTKQGPPPGDIDLLSGLKKTVNPAIVVFDEAHNIDDVCIESRSVKLKIDTLDMALSNIKRLQHEVELAKQSPMENLKKEYEKILAGLILHGDVDPETAQRIRVPNIDINDPLVHTVIPGSIRKGEHFLSQLQAVTGFLRGYICCKKPSTEGTLLFLHRIREAVTVEDRELRAYSVRLQSLITTLKIKDLDTFSAISRVCEVCSLAATHRKGFAVICDPFPKEDAVYDPEIELCCLDPAIAMQAVTERYSTVVLTSGTLSPLWVYPRMLNLTNMVVAEAIGFSLPRNCILPLVISKAQDNSVLSSRFDLRDDKGVIRAYGRMLESFVETVPDGIVGFFTSKIYMKLVIREWYESGYISKIQSKRPIFIETDDVVETTLMLAKFRTACDNGGGAVFLAVARGKVSEGIDFDRHYGRCVIAFGVPFQYTLSRKLRARLQYTNEVHGISEQDFLTFDAMRATAQCVGRVIRNKSDYGIMVFADARFSRSDKRGKLPEWIRKFLEPGLCNLAVDMAVSASKQFLLQMSQPFDHGGLTSAGQPTRLSALDLKMYVPRLQAQSASTAGLDESKSGKHSDENPYGVIDLPVY